MKVSLIATLVGLASILLAFALKGVKGAEGMALGLVGSAINLGALWGVIRLIGNIATENAPPKWGAFLMVLAFLMKMPIFVGMSIAAKALGPSATNCFLVGIALVYSATIGWVLARR